MKRSEVFIGAAAGLLAACAKTGVTPSSMLPSVPGFGLADRRIRLLDSNCYSYDYSPKFNKAWFRCGSVDAGWCQIVGETATLYFSENNQWQTLTLVKGDPKWTKQKMFKLWEQYWYEPNTINGGTLYTYDGTTYTKFMDAVFNPDPNVANVTVTCYYGPMQGQYVQLIGPPSLLLEVLVNKWACTGAALGLVGGFLLMASTEWTVVGAIGGAAVVIGGACAVRGECF